MGLIFLIGFILFKITAPTIVWVVYVLFALAKSYKVVKDIKNKGIKEYLTKLDELEKELKGIDVNTKEGREEFEQKKSKFQQRLEEMKRTHKK